MVDSSPYALNSNCKPSSSSNTSSSESSRVAHGQSGSNQSLTQRSQRHSAPSSYTLSRSTQNNNNTNHNNNKPSARQEEDPHSRQSLFDLLQYLFVFFFTYIKFILQRVFPFRGPFFNSFVDVSRSPEPIITEPPEKETHSQYLFAPAASSQAFPLRKSSLQTVSSSHCQRPCCRSASFSGEQTNINNQVNTNRYSSIRDLLQDRNKARHRVFFPLTIFPFSLAVTAYQHIFNLNRFLELSRISRYYKSAVQMRERFRNLFRWRPTSPEELDQAENAILSSK